ncbi:hypothetical protein [Microbulbifer litoralis]|uniref:hypothetical protein n=1 Tax=Microbulbifer litoralis TaxID=2933965 RepID=UPI0020277C24|nr:hypothetical protein [Microbulbifer sp. GX H0434]
MSFRVVFTGELREGFSRRRGIESLAQRFNLGFEEIKRLLTGNRQTVKSADSRQQAERIVRALWGGGWHSELVRNGRVLFRTNRPERADAPTGEVDSRQTLTAVDGSFSVSVPAGWQYCEDLNPQALLQVGDARNHHYLMALAQSVAELPETLALADYCDAQLQQCVDKVADGRLCAPAAPLLECRLPAYAGEIAALLGEVEIRYLIACLQSADRFYTLFLWCEREAFERQRVCFSEIVAAFNPRAPHDAVESAQGELVGS